ncbi:hypothetical protein [Sphaerisporangium sp. TRM90804]|uniref:hypothetical protein n=1 Tax=Sphaerisporangium sp. TRM90804 TaxID=3031113 RepID=UPI00244AABE9|nr:hypothetical protein [Sphaerisporangium sp. TRM90804]MDH2430407.1 hypothetical protein [Sphaerisporangium sp. TRM90804]
MIERADQLVLEYVSKVADLAHGVLRTEERLDFVRRLRSRIEEERRGAEDLGTVRKVLARFGDPAALLQRELQRLDAADQQSVRRDAAGRPASESRLPPPSTGRRLPSGGRVQPSAGGRPAAGSAARAAPSAGGRPVPSPGGGRLPSSGGGRPSPFSGGRPGRSAGRPAPFAGGGRVVPGSSRGRSLPPPGADRRRPWVPETPKTPAPGADDFGDSATEVLPAVVDDAPTAVVGDGRPVVAEETVLVEGVRPLGPEGLKAAAGGARPGAGPSVVREAGSGRPPLSRPARRPSGTSVPSSGTRVPMGAHLRDPVSADGRDAATILRDDRREVAGMALLVLAALLIPLPLPYLAIFPVPVLVWAAGAVTVLAGEAWAFRDRVAGATAPVVAYSAGGVVLGALRSSEEPGEGFQAFVASFWHVSGLMFMIGTAGGVLWLGYRLLRPPPPPPRRPMLTMTR